MRRNGRPVFLNLLQIRMPPPALLSIAHRASGVLLILVLPFVIALFGRSLAGPEGFAEVRGLFSGLPMRVLLFLLGWGLLHHLFSGVRFLLIDFDIGVERSAARRSAWIVIASGLAAALLSGVIL